MQVVDSFTRLPLIAQCLLMAGFFAALAFSIAERHPPKPKHASSEYDKLHAKFGPMNRIIRVLSLAGFGFAMLPAVTFGYRRSAFLWVGVWSLGAVAMPLLYLAWRKLRDPRLDLLGLLAYTREYNPPQLKFGWRTDMAILFGILLYGLVSLFALTYRT